MATRKQQWDEALGIRPVSENPLIPDLSSFIPAGLLPEEPQTRKDKWSSAIGPLREMQAQAPITYGEMERAKIERGYREPAAVQEPKAPLKIAGPAQGENPWLRPVKLFEQGMSESLPYQALEKGIEKTGLEIKRPTQPSGPRGVEWVPYLLGRTIGELPAIIGAYGTGGAAAAGTLETIAPMAPRVLANPITQEAVRGTGAGLTYGAALSAVEGLPIDETIKVMVENGLLFGALDPAAGVLGRAIQKGLTKSAKQGTQAVAEEVAQPAVAEQVQQVQRRPAATYRLPDYEQRTMDELTRGIETAQNYVRHNDILAAYPQGTTVEAALADIRANTGVDLQGLVNNVLKVQSRPSLKQISRQQADSAGLAQAAGVFNVPKTITRDMPRGTALRTPGPVMSAGESVAPAPMKPEVMRQSQVKPVQEVATVGDVFNRPVLKYKGQVKEPEVTATSERPGLKIVKPEGEQARARAFFDEVNRIATAKNVKVGSAEYDAIMAETIKKYPDLQQPTTAKPEPVKTDTIPIDSRTFDEVGSRSVKAYQYENPEVQPYFKTEAQRLLTELKDTVKGERYYTRTEEGTNVTGTKKFTSESITRIQEATNATYKEIEDALQRIINDKGQENQALAKRVELIIDDNLSKGTKSFEGIDLPANDEYIAIKERIRREEVAGQPEAPRAEQFTDDDIDMLFSPEERELLKPKAEPERPRVDIKIPEMQRRIAEGEGPAVADDITGIAEKWTKENAEFATEQAQTELHAGVPLLSIKIGGQKPSYKFQTREGEKVFTASGTKQNNLLNKAVEKLTAWKNDLTYKPHLKDYPEAREWSRIMQDSGGEAIKESHDVLAAITGKLKNDEYDLFRWIVAGMDMLEDAANGLATPLAKGNIKTELNAMMNQASASVKQAVNRHFQAMKLVGKDLQARGKIMEGKDFYYPHKIIEYAQNLAIGTGKKIKTPVRMYTKQRMGTMREIDMDYMEVMSQHLSRVFLDNKLDDAIPVIAGRFNVMGKLTAEQQRAIMQGKPVKLGDEIIKGWQPDAGNYVFKTTGLKGGSDVERTIGNMVDDVMVSVDREEAVAAVKDYLKDRLAIGTKKPVYALPEAIVQELNNFKDYTKNGPMQDVMKGYTSFFKRWILNPVSFVPYNTWNVIGDTLNLAREDWKALGKLPVSIWSTFAKGKAPEWWRNFEIDKKYLDEVAGLVDLKMNPGSKKGTVKISLPELGEKLRVKESGFIGRRGVSPIMLDPRLSRFKSLPLKITTATNPVNILEAVSHNREEAWRMAKLAADIERIAQGKNVVYYTEKYAEKLPKITGAGWAARTAAVDYGAMSQTARKSFADAFFPFIAWYAGNANQWAKWAATEAGNILKGSLKDKANAVKSATFFLGPLVAATIWNNSGDRKKTEDMLDDWVRHTPHLNTGYLDKDGKPIVVFVQHPIYSAASMVGLDRTETIARRLFEGKITWQEAMLEQAKETGKAPIETAGSLLNPVLKGPLGAIAGKDITFEVFDAIPLTPEKYEGTPEDTKRRIEYAAKTIAAPLSPFVKMARDMNPLEASPGEVVQKTLASGPFRTPGIHRVNVEAAEQRKRYDAQSKARTIEKMAKLKIEDAFVEAVLSGKNDGFQEAIKDVYSQGVYLSEEQITNIMTTPATLLRILYEQRRQTTDEAKRKEIDEKIKALKLYREQESLKTLPKAIRGKFAEEVQGGG